MPWKISRYRLRQNLGFIHLTACPSFLYWRTCLISQYMSTCISTNKYGWIPNICLPISLSMYTLVIPCLMHYYSISELAFYPNYIQWNLRDSNTCLDRTWFSTKFSKNERITKDNLRDSVLFVSTTNRYCTGLLIWMN